VLACVLACVLVCVRACMCVCDTHMCVTPLDMGRVMSLICVCE